MDNSNSDLNQPPATQVQTPQPAEVQNSIPDNTEYESNPFTLAFRGFSLLSKYAKGVFITLLILGLLSTISNTFDSVFQQDNTFTSDTITINDDLEGRLDTSLNSIDINDDSSDLRFNGETVESEDVEGLLAVLFGITIVVMLLGILFFIFVVPAFTGTVAAAMVSASQQKEISIGEAFSLMTKRYWTLLKALLLAALRTFGGYLLLIVPGVRAQLRYSAVAYVVMMNPEMTATESVNETKRLYNGHLMEVFGINFTGIIPIAGSVLTTAGLGLSAKQLSEYDKAGKETPPASWVNYLGLLILLIPMFFVLVVLLISAG